VNKHHSNNENPYKSADGKVPPYTHRALEAMMKAWNENPGLCAEQPGRAIVAALGLPIDISYEDLMKRQRGKTYDRAWQLICGAAGSVPKAIDKTVLLLEKTGASNGAPKAGPAGLITDN
jgi:hypothetical protein